MIQLFVIIQLDLMKEPSKGLSQQEGGNRMLMKDTLRDSKMFEEFMRFTVSEYCSECLFSIIEMMQFKLRCAQISMQGDMCWLLT